MGERDKEDKGRWWTKAGSGGRSTQTHSYTMLLVIWSIWKVLFGMSLKDLREKLVKVNQAL